MAGTVTRADRLNRIVAKVAPKAWAFHSDVVEVEVEEAGKKVKKTITGRWPRRSDDTRALGPKALEEPQGAAPYQIETMEGKFLRRVRVFGDDGDVITGLGQTVEECLTQLETKLGLPAGHDANQPDTPATPADK